MENKIEAKRRAKEVNSNINLDELFSIPFSIIIAKEWDINYIIISEGDIDKVSGVIAPHDSRGCITYEIGSLTAKKILNAQHLLIDKETLFYVAYSNVSNVRDYFKAKRVFSKLEKIEDPDPDEKFKIGIARDVIKGVEAQISTKRKIQ